MRRAVGWLTVFFLSGLTAFKLGAEESCEVTCITCKAQLNPNSEGEEDKFIKEILTGCEGKVCSYDSMFSATNCGDD